MTEVEIRTVSMLNRAMVAGIAEALINDGQPTKADALINAVRCCDAFPECSHILEWVEKSVLPPDQETVS